MLLRNIGNRNNLNYSDSVSYLIPVPALHECSESSLPKSCHKLQVRYVDNFGKSFRHGQNIINPAPTEIRMSQPHSFCIILPLHFWTCQSTQWYKLQARCPPTTNNDQNLQQVQSALLLSWAFPPGTWSRYM